MDSKSIVILGAGNVATHISRHLFLAGHQIAAVYSRTTESAEELALRVNANPSTKLDELPREADFYIIALPDRLLEEKALELAGFRGTFLHTAGALPMEILAEAARDTGEGYGVLYPLQSLSKNSKVSREKVPVLIEASDKATMKKLKGLASSTWNQVSKAGREERLKLHLAAVFANNFSNFMLRIASDFLQDEGLDWELLEPLVKQTYRKALKLGPAAAQTGPAQRGDMATMEKHLELLKDREGLEKIYTFVSRAIADARIK